MTSMISDYPKRVPPVVADFGWYYGSQPQRIIQTSTGRNISGVIGSTYSTIVLADNPISWYRFSETSGTTAADQLKQHNGTYTGGFTLNQTGPLQHTYDNTAMSLNGTSGYVSVSGNPLSGLTTWGIENWALAPSSATQSGLANFFPVMYNLFSGYSGTSLTTLEGFVSMNFPGPGGTTGLSYPTTLTAGKWYHVAVTCDNTNLYLYLNGAQVATSAAPIFAPSTFVIGQEGAGLSWWIGGLDEMALYGYTLSPSQIANHYTAGITPAAATPNWVDVTPLQQVISFDAIDQQNLGLRTTIAPAGVSIVDYKWDFGNGQVGHGPFASTTYNYSKPPPDMQVSLTVTDSHNRMYSCAHRLNLQALTPTYATSLRERG